MEIDDVRRRRRPRGTPCPRSKHVGEGRFVPSEIGSPGNTPSMSCGTARSSWSCVGTKQAATPNAARSCARLCLVPNQILALQRRVRCGVEALAPISSSQPPSVRRGGLAALVGPTSRRPADRETTDETHHPIRPCLYRPGHRCRRYRCSGRPAQRNDHRHRPARA